MSQVRAIALDVDGTLTDGSFLWGPDGGEWKQFSFRDVMGISLARKRGYHVALISGESSPLVDRLAAKLELADVYKGCKDKAAAFQDFMLHRCLSAQEVGFMGDDVNDLPAMELAGFTAAPADAQPAVIARVDLVAASPGGKGAVREVLEHLWKLSQDPRLREAS